MASKINKTFAGSITGILDINEDGIFVEVEDIESPVSLADFFADFNNKDVTVKIGNKIEF